MFKQVLWRLVVSSIFLLFGAQHALAQEDETWYKMYIKQRDFKHKNSLTLNPRLNQLTQSNLRTNVACDLSTNGDFESQRVPPSRTGNMGGQLTGQNAPDELNDWYSPTFATPDYLATNGTQIDVRPQEENGVTASSTPFSGSGEIGLYSRQPYNDGIIRDRVSEYATAPLSQLPNGALENARYYAQMWVSLSHSKNPCNYGISNSFGMCFTSNDNFKTLSSRDFLAVPAGAQTIFNSSPIGQSALNNGALSPTSWQRISGQIQGAGERFVTLGLFNSDPGNMILLPGGNNTRPNTYVFVDAFQLFKIPTAGPSLATCRGTVTIGEGCNIPDATYAWTIAGSSTVFATSLQTQVSPATTTTYTLTVTLPDRSVFSSPVTVTVTQPSAGPDKTICAGQSATIGVGCAVPGGTYAWTVQGSSSMFATTLQTTVSPTATTTYVQTVSLPNGSSFSSSVTVSVAPAAAPIYPSFYIGRYVGCRKYYDVVMQPVPGATRYVAYIGIGGNTAEGSIEGVLNSSGTITFALDVEGANQSATANVVVNVSGPCGTINGSITQVLQGPDQSCAPPGDGQTSLVGTPYPNPANEAILLPAYTGNVQLFNNMGREVKASNQDGKLNVQNLPEGLYILRMEQQGKVISKPIQIRH